MLVGTSVEVVAGRVTRGGSGPCYGLITDDGTEYALYSTAGIRLDEGSYIRIRFAALTIPVSLIGTLMFVKLFDFSPF